MNKNNYLSFEISENLLDEICAVQQRISEQYFNAGFQPVKRDTLHMTLCYFGTAYHRLKPSERQAFVNDLHDINVHSIKLINPRIECFPPGKGNLYILRYDTNRAGHELVRGLRQRFKHLCANDRIDEWIPHITLGKVRHIKHMGKIDNIYISDFNPTSLKLCPLFNE